jgi:hypothetical protein
MKVTYLAAAGSEFEEATGYYNKERAGLGFEFADEVKQTLERIKNYPEAWTPALKANTALSGSSFFLTV